MKEITVYICEKCKKESRVRGEIEICEAQHLGLSMEEKREYDNLAEKVISCMSTQSRTCNNETRKASDEAIDEILAFEKEHGIE